MQMLNLKNLNKSVPITVTGIFLSLLAAGFFLNTTSLSWSDIVTLSLKTAQTKLLTINFALFLSFISLALAFTCLAALKLSLRTAMLSALAGSLPAALLTLALFPGTSDHLISIAGIPLPLMALTWTTSIKLTEIKKFIRFRSFMAGIGTFTLILCILIVLSGMLAIMPKQKEYLSHWEKEIGEQAAGKNMQESFAKATLDSQFNLLAEIHSSKQYTAMSQLQDPSAKAFDEYFINIVMQIDKARKHPENMLEGSAPVKMEKLDVHSLLEKQIPGYTLFSKYFYIAYPLMIAMLVISLGNLIFRLLGSTLALLLSALTKNI